MNWNEYYEGFTTWEENDQIDNLLTVDSLGPADQVTDIIEDFPIYLLFLTSCS